MLIRAPESWPHALVAVVAMLLLAALDLGGAFVAKEAVLRRSPLMAGIGVVLFVGLFWVYASSLQYAELGPVTLGWVVLLQIGVVLLDRYRYQAALPAGKWVAVIVILLAQAYLLLGPQPTATSAAAPAVGPVPAATSAADVFAFPDAVRGRHVALPSDGAVTPRRSIGRHVAVTGEYAGRSW